jgi:hypothetical protein
VLIRSRLAKARDEWLIVIGYLILANALRKFDVS